MSGPWFHVATVVGMIAAVMTMASGLIWVERKLLALWQDRRGPNRVGPLGIFQVVADLLKIFTKHDWVPPFADKPLFVLAPAVVLVTAFLSFAVISFAPGVVVADLDIGVLFFLAMSALGPYGIVLAGWSSNSKYPLLGSLRAAAQLISYEVFMGLSILGVVLMAGSLQPSRIVEAQRGMWFCIPQAAGLAAFLVAGLAEAFRLPFDLAEAEQELVAGYHVEYSGMKFALFYLSEYVGLTLIASVTVTLFFGGYLGPFLPPLAWFVIKVSLLIALFILVRGSLPRVRYDQLMGLGWKVLLPLSLVNLLVTGAVLLARR